MTDGSTDPAGHSESETDKVTVVVMTRDRWTDLQRSLPRHRAPVVLVDNGSRDGTPDAVRQRFPHVKVVEADRNLGAMARNIGVALATTEYVAFADDDSWWAPGSLVRAAELLDSDPRLGLVAGCVLIGQQARADPVCIQMRDSPLPAEPGLPGPAIMGFPACGAVVRRQAYQAAGGFDDVVFFLGEEERLALDLASLGWRMAYVEDLLAHHYPSESRNRAQREVRIRRNALLTAVMRRPWSIVARAAVRLLRDGATGRRALVAAAWVLPKALVRRRRVPQQVERAARLLENG